MSENEGLSVDRDLPLEADRQILLMHLDAWIGYALELEQRLHTLVGDEVIDEQSVDQ